MVKTCPLETVMSFIICVPTLFNGGVIKLQGLPFQNKSLFPDIKPFDESNVSESTDE